MPKHHRQYPLFCSNHRETHPAYGGGSKGRRRSEADGGDGTGELHGGGVLAPMLGGSLSTGGKPCSSVVSCAGKWDQKHVLVAVVRAFFLMTFPITRLLVCILCMVCFWKVFYYLLFFLVCDALLSLPVLTCRNSYSRCTGIWYLVSGGTDRHLKTRHVLIEFPRSTVDNM